MHAHENTLISPLLEQSLMFFSFVYVITVNLGKLRTPEIFLQCDSVARKKPIRHVNEKTKLQARLLISLWFCG